MAENCVKKIGAVEFECIHWKKDGENYDEVVAFAEGKASYDHQSQQLILETLGGVVKVWMGGYWILKDKLKNLSVVADKIFEKNFYAGSKKEKKEEPTKKEK